MFSEVVLINSLARLSDEYSLSGENILRTVMQAGKKQSDLIFKSERKLSSIFYKRDGIKLNDIFSEIRHFEQRLFV